MVTIIEGNNQLDVSMVPIPVPPSGEVEVLNVTIPPEVPGTKGSHPEAMLGCSLLVSPPEGAVAYTIGWSIIPGTSGEGLSSGTAGAQIGDVPHWSTQKPGRPALLPYPSEYYVEDDIYFGSMYEYHPERLGIASVVMTITRYKSTPGAPDYETELFKAKIGEINVV